MDSFAVDTYLWPSPSSSGAEDAHGGAGRKRVSIARVVSEDGIATL